jgi:UDP-glucose 4-epimerase
LFNVAGGRDPDPTRIVPRVLSVAAGASQYLEVNGDGTATRDYLHVADAAAAFVAAVERCPPVGATGRYNIGSGVASSVRDLVAAAERVTGRPVAVRHRPAAVAAATEPGVIVAGPRRAGTELGWRARCSGLDEVVADAWKAFRPG